MKRFLLAVLSTLYACALWSAEADLYFVTKPDKLFAGAVKTESAGHVWILFKLSPDAPEKMPMTTFYVFADQDSKTGRKNMGNEYYVNLTGKAVTVYDKDGSGSSAYRKSVNVFTQDGWLMVAIDRNAVSAYPLNEFKIYWNAKPYANTICFYGSKKIRITLPKLPEIKNNTPAAAPAKSVKAVKKTTAPKSVKKSAVLKSDAEVKRVPLPKTKVISWIADGIRRSFNVNDYNGKKSVEIRVPRNATGDFNFAIWYGVNKRGALYISWTPPMSKSGDTLGGDAVKIYKAAEVPFIEPVDPALKHELRFPANTMFRRKQVPDRLVRYHQGSRTGDYKLYLYKRFNSYHGTIEVPTKAKPGIYTTIVTIKHPSGEEKLTVNINVENFTLPERPSFIMFADLPRMVDYQGDLLIAPEHRGYNGVALNLRECLRNLKSHRVAPRKMLAEVPLKFDAQGTPHIDFAAFDAFCSFVIDELKMNPRFEMPLATVSTGHNAHYTKLFGPVGLNYMSDEFKKKYTATMKTVLKHIREKNWEKYFLAYFADEPSRDQTPQTREIIKLIRSVDPKLEPWMFGTGPSKDYLDILTTWMAGFGIPLEEGEIELDAKDDAMQIARKRGDKIGLYNPHPAYVLTRQPAYTRTLYWWAYQYNLYWMNMYCMGYFRTGTKDISNAGYWAWWVYPPEPGKQMMWDNSIRWEATRAGLTDYEYLKALENQIAALKKVIPAAAGVDPRQVVLNYVNALCRNKMEHSENEDKVIRVRNLISDELAADAGKLNGFAYYKFNKDKVEFYVCAKPDSVVTVNGQSQKAAGIPLLWVFPVKGNADKAVKVTIVHGGTTQSFSKTVLLPF